MIKRSTDKKMSKNFPKITSQNAPSRKINESELFSMIQKKAYEYFLARGCGHGDDLRDWFLAEKDVLKNVHK